MNYAQTKNIHFWKSDNKLEHHGMLKNIGCLKIVHRKQTTFYYIRQIGKQVKFKFHEFNFNLSSHYSTVET